MRRLAALLLALGAVLGVGVAVPQSAVADGPIGTITEGACDIAVTTSLPAVRW
ncbi:hypothetical protein GCM10010389_66030 [Streptomyces echinoruber]|uniref:Uncharacterized protein n=1 Tax=Streptomyces echinoruber TaxID=68898 RepID=A0A918S2T7_9ACTN|nr:hypothetical protein GCM10010389_66030 [Streptomyces echinoruber]